MPSPDRVDVHAILGSLKGFQRRSAEHIFDRLYGDDATRRFLLADEVGLGKTHVARGVIAKTIEHLQAAGEKRIDVVYICSNADIARQNISRLNVTGRNDFQLASRITLLPNKVRELEDNTLNFVSFTPGTSFNLGSSEGKGEERLLLYWLLKWTWPSLAKGTGAKNVLQGAVSTERFRGWIRDTDPHQWIDRKLAAKFTARILDEDKRRKANGERSLRDQFEELCRRFKRNRKRIPSEDKHVRRMFIGEMRVLLAATCIESLEPDLIVLDEFQRFKELLDSENDAGALARHLFNWGEARVLLLSATPYKMYTLSHESETDDHYRDFVDTLRFLFDHEDRLGGVQTELADYGRACTRIDREGFGPLQDAKRDLENSLRHVMCRTEKLAVTEDRSGMLRDVGDAGVSLQPAHIRGYLGTKRIADALGHPEIIEYWKASPYLLNFMDADHYKLKSLFDKGLEQQDELLEESLSENPGVLLDRDTWRDYQKVDSQHAQLDHLMAETTGRGWHKRLWMPPSYPNHQLEGVFAESGAETMTKRLIFSSWHVVPKAISILLSFDAERQMMTDHEPDARNTLEERERRRPLLMFTRSAGRLTGMPVLAMLYPGMALASLGTAGLDDAVENSAFPSLGEVLGSVAHRMRDQLEPIVRGASTDGPEDESWYWAAPILLDRSMDETSTESWFEDIDQLAKDWSGEQKEARGWREHVAQAAEVASGAWRPSGRPPSDLAEVLALYSVAGPAVCSLRAFANELGSECLSDPDVRESAGRAGWGLRSLFNGLEVIALIRGMNGREPYWRRVLEYCADGCLQSVLDEYVHLLVEGEGLVDLDCQEAASRLADVLASTAGMRSATPGLDWIERDDDGRHVTENQRVRARFAMRFGDERGERDESSLRKETVRKAFNSPFWPFVLATTSIGQEGLDFHSYCHAVVHWNLPSNPVDLEQREGRIHRYKGHAVRKNVARMARDSGPVTFSGNPWGRIFEHASTTTDGDSDISPYWVFPIEGGAAIQRHVPSLPLSRESARLPALRRSLAVYRMVFGQPRQQDLLEHMKDVVPEHQWAELTRQLAICLEPPGIEAEC